MKALFRKDLYSWWQTCYFMLLLPAMNVVFCIEYAIQGKPLPLPMFIYSACFMCVTPGTLHVQDVTSKWFIYSFTLPVKRSETVAEKYLLALILGAGVDLIMLLTVGLCAVLGGDLSGAGTMLLTVSAMGLLPATAFLPVSFAMSDKSQAARSLVGALIGGFLGGGAVMMTQRAFDSEPSAASQAVLLGVVMVLFGISWAVSTAINNRKDMA
ncbi:MAG: ABC-2 transporter permease [Ruminococcus sp.]|nr:ABC-2 transporter permease [Ruminococcus sp.]